jgi:hypothetical protein
MNIPWGQDWQTVCENMPADIAGQHFARPTRCINNAGMWGEFDVQDPSCGPYWGPFTPAHCSSGSRVYSARLWNITGDWMAACLATPAVVGGQTFSPPLLQCVDRGGAEGMWGEVSIADGACADLSVRGTVTYDDGSSAPRPFTFGTIEVWACGTWAGPSCSWSKIASASTDNAGRFSVTLAGPRDLADKYVVRVVAENDAAYVYAQDTANLFYADLGPEQTATTSSRTLVFDRHFGNSGYDLFVSRHLNPAQKLRVARRIVDRFRDSSETDTIGKVAVAPALGTNIAFTNSGTIRIHPDDLRNDRKLLHEYAHFVQENIGAYFIAPRFHSACNLTDPQFAWFEGFPEFFQKAVRLMNAADFQLPQAPVSLAAFTPRCPGITPADSAEGVVTDVLFLLLNDGDGACTGIFAPVCTRYLWNTRASMIMGIFDREFDFSAPGEKNLQRFRQAWIARGGSTSYINQVYSRFGL